MYETVNIFLLLNSLLLKEKERNKHIKKFDSFEHKLSLNKHKKILYQ